MNHASIYEVQAGAFSLVFGRRTLIMGIINVTPDSFSDGGLFFDRDKAIDHGKRLAEGGADIVDVGGESSRPFSEPVSADEESRRILPVVEKLAGCLSVPVSIDTTKAIVARRAIESGASLVNDIGAMRLDPDMVHVVADTGVPVIIMHMKGTPKDMQIEPSYTDVVAEVKRFFQDRLEETERAGVDRQRVILDPGIGFGKTVPHNLLLLKHISTFLSLGVPVMVGPSRKSFIAKILGSGDEQRENGTQAAVATAAYQGVHMVRVHDVVRARQTLQVVDAIRSAGR